MKLFIDDIRPAPKGWYLARTVTEAIRLIDLYEWEAISLDHDIFFPCTFGEETITKMKNIDPFNAHASKEDFTAVARFITYRFKSPDDAPGTIFIHTANPVGYERLKAILEGFNVVRETTYIGEWLNKDG